jgi:hypothetical protein
MEPKVDLLFCPQPPWLLHVRGPHSDVTNNVWELQRKMSPGSIVRFLRGSRMRTTEGLYDEFAAALQFPYYFGRNGAAFDECLTDLGWLKATAYVLMVFDAEEFLANEQRTELESFIDSFERTCESWSTPDEHGEPWDHPAIPFHVLFHSTAESASQLPSRIAALPILNFGKIMIPA